MSIGSYERTLFVVAGVRGIDLDQALERRVGEGYSVRDCGYVPGFDWAVDLWGWEPADVDRIVGDLARDLDARVEDDTFLDDYEAELLASGWRPGDRTAPGVA